MKKDFLNKDSIGRQLLFRIVLMSTLITSALTIINFFHDYKNQISKIDKTLEYVEKTTLSSIGLALWNYDKEQMSNIVNGLSGIDFITEIKIFTPTKDLFFSTAEQQVSNRFLIAKNYPLGALSQGKLKQVGRLELTITKEHIYAQLLESSVFFFISQGIKTLIVSIFILLVFFQLVGKPLFSVSSHFKLIDLKNLKKLDPNIWAGFPKSEISTLGTALNQLIDRVIEHEKLNIEEIERQSAFLTDTINHLPIGFFARLDNSTDVIINGQLRKIFSVENSKVNSQTDKPLRNHHRLDSSSSPNLGKLLEAKLTEIENVCSEIALPIGVGHEIEITNTGGEKRFCDLIKFPYLDASGQQYAMGHLLIDNTHKREIERMANHQSKLALLGELAAGVGHEINNPLTIIVGTIEKLKKEAKADGDRADKRAALLETMCISAKRIANINLGLRNFSRLESQEREVFDISNLVQESYLLLNDIYESEGVALSLNNQMIGESVLIDGNRGKLQQVLINLLSNAKDACASEPNGKIEIVMREDRASSLIIEVKDSGTGINPDIAQKIFEPFFTTKELNHGTGLGLSLAFNCAKEHNGKLRYILNSDQGTTFTLSLPIYEKIKDNPASIPKVLANESTLVLYNFNAIVLDDEGEVAGIMCDILEDMGIKSQIFTSGESAYLEFVAFPNRYDLIISDMKMPKMDGPSFLKKIRSHRDLAQPHFIFMTGGVNVSFEEDEFRNIIDGYFYKPFVLAEVSALMAKIFEKNSNKKAA